MPLQKLTFSCIFFSYINKKPEKSQLTTCKGHSKANSSIVNIETINSESKQAQSRTSPISFTETESAFTYVTLNLNNKQQVLILVTQIWLTIFLIFFYKFKPCVSSKKISRFRNNNSNGFAKYSSIGIESRLSPRSLFHLLDKAKANLIANNSLFQYGCTVLLFQKTKAAFVI